MTQLTALVAELRKEVCNLETSIEDEEDRAVFAHVSSMRLVQS